MSTSPRNPTKSPQLKRCWPNSASIPLPSSHSMHCTAKKIVRMRSRGQSHADRPGQRQPAHPAPALPRYRRRHQAPHYGPKPHPRPQPRTSAAPSASSTRPMISPVHPAVLCGRHYPGRAGGVYPQCCDWACYAGRQRGPSTSATHQPTPSAPPQPSGRTGALKTRRTMPAT